MAELFGMFPDNKTTMVWFEKKIWKGKRRCGRCDNTNTYIVEHQTTSYKCGGCKKCLSIKFGTVMVASQ